ncbi:30S ribosomal protein S3 [Candidatus Nanohalovita haloferacivicina]|uniref:30S ribosomal protein S3 n=1 Tax=Candidatus Nanohalovita haloferacivicina TaxID=2978046 RepID=UPI00325F9DDE|nr:Ribosomal protein S3 [Candidatus Nanohalobia archaeon BNXNv]
MQEKKFIQKGARKVRLHEFLEEELEGAGYSHADLVRTPTSAKIVIYAQRPGLVIGRGGSRIKELTADLEEEFDFDNPQIEVNEIENADADAEVVAKSIANWLEKGGHAKRVGYTYIRRMKEAGVIGAEVEITGKLSGNRGRTEKFSFGYVKRCGNTSKENVDKGYSLARTKPGAIGVKVRMMKEMPDFMHRDVDVSEKILHESEVTEEAENKADRIEKVLIEAESMTSSELERAIEEKGEEFETSDISKQEVRDAFEARDEEPEEVTEPETEEDEETTEEEPEESDTESEQESDQEEAEEQEETQETETDVEEIVSGTISDAKDAISEMEDPDYGAILQAEQANKNRTTFIDWLEGQQ